MATTTAELFPWKEAYKVNVKELDAHHKDLIRQINVLHTAMVTGKGKDALGQILSKLAKYTNFHFAKEEELMSTTGYPDLAAHKLAHQELTGRVLQLQQEFMAGEVALGVEVMDLLKGWLEKHILAMDKKYGPFLNAKGVL
jgi:hemerythrin-like metal-binding protein